ncbi:RNA polymerase sigma-I factor [Paenibacillus sp. DMB20]|uniref:RNA polymerase sigma-I factor n=1 Tax=Paenibacillus sp. DMB20 TaxID=1642570 RepID=UPI000A575966|nr:RNA polymerase sigma-I factor [Paenibacillus sp. DMB20]
MLDSRSIETAIKRAQEGNRSERDWIIEQYRPFILRTVSRVCKRQIRWEHDEASIGMIALNEAIDRYDGRMGKSFDNFAYLMIHNRLVDEFRRQGKISKSESVILNDNGDLFDQTSSEIASSLEVYNREQSATELAMELLAYDEALQEFGVTLEELEDCSPKHRDTRKQMIQIAKRFSEEPDWIDILKKTKRLPIKKMLEIFKVGHKTLERNRKYIIALVLIYACPEFERIRSIVSFASIEE